MPVLNRFAVLPAEGVGASGVLRAALVVSCFLGALPPVDLRAVCFVRAMCLKGKSFIYTEWREMKEGKMGGNV